MNRHIWTFAVASTAAVAGLVFLNPGWMAWLHQHPTLMMGLGAVLGLGGALHIYQLWEGHR